MYLSGSDTFLGINMVYVSGYKYDVECVKPAFPVKNRLSSYWVKKELMKPEY